MYLQQLHSFINESMATMPAFLCSIMIARELRNRVACAAANQCIIKTRKYRDPIVTQSTFILPGQKIEHHGPTTKKVQFLNNKYLFSICVTSGPDTTNKQTMERFKDNLNDKYIVEDSVHKVAQKHMFNTSAYELIDNATHYRGTILRDANKILDKYGIKIHDIGITLKH